ncbi:MAG TPA: cobyrinic acid a,c-diamide synthase [Nitrospiraceae bacterium]|nr:cobyrinic acid a,c-diamide synthase [Nitrospiraceae bacterium]
MSENMITVRLELKNDAIKEELERIISSVGGYSIRKTNGSGYCDLLVMEVSDRVNGEFDFVSSLKKSGKVGEVFLTSSSTESDVLIHALRTGAKEFFPQPLRQDEVASSLIKFRDQMKDAPMNLRRVKRGKIINVIGSKGGVGTTTVAVNLAASLNDLEDVKSVAVIDMNLIFGEVPLFLDVKTAFNWGEVAKNISRLDSTYLMSVLAKHPSGVYILPSPTDVNGENYATPEIIEQLLDVMVNEFDFIIVDNGQSLNQISRKILELSDTVLLVSILSLPCLINVKRLLETFWNLGYPREDRVKIVMNRYHKNSVLSINEAEEGTGKEISWLIPNDYNTSMSAINQGKVISSIMNKSEISSSFRDLALALMDKNESKKGKKGFWSWKNKG